MNSHQYKRFLYTLHYQHGVSCVFIFIDCCTLWGPKYIINNCDISQSTIKVINIAVNDRGILTKMITYVTL
jgi:hypothetical protein